MLSHYNYIKITIIWLFWYSFFHIVYIKFYYYILYIKNERIKKQYGI